MLTPQMVDGFMAVDMNMVDVVTLSDIRTIRFDNALPTEKRVEHVLSKLKNPFCFRFGDMGIQLVFDDNAPPMQEVLTNFLIRKKSGL